MEFTVKNVPVAEQRSACVVVGVTAARQPGPSAAALDSAAGGLIVNVLKRGDMKPGAGETLWLHDLPGTEAERVLLVDCGEEETLSDRTFRKVVRGMATQLRDAAARNALCCLAEIPVRDRDTAWKVRQIVEVTASTLYRFEAGTMEDAKPKKKGDRPRLSRLYINLNDTKEVAAAREAARIGRAVAEGMALARDLGNLPPNVCTPSYLAAKAQALADANERMEARALEEEDMTRLGMGALLAVARGSREPPRLIEINWKGGAKNAQPVLLVGKGITFDSGGISIKPAAAMDEMKYDMCGAASVLGVMAAIARLGLPLNVVGLIPAAENLPDGNATRPGDVVTTLSGKTVEILNTDAEGRLVLCDALTYGERFKPTAVVDVATLTGACVIALGKHAAGLLGNDLGLVGELKAAGEDTGDRAWELPLWEEYQEQLKSNFADLANVGGREAGTITGACFLARFAEAFPWAHLDIAGVAWQSGKAKGATGRPVPLLVEFLRRRAEGRRRGAGARGAA